MWVPNGKVKLGGSKWLDASRLGSIPSGRLWAVNASKATAASGIALSGEPRTVNWPPAKLDVLLGRFQLVGGDAAGPCR